MWITEETKIGRRNTKGEVVVKIGRYNLRKVRRWLEIMDDFNSGGKEDLSIKFTKSWVKDRPYGLTIMSFPQNDVIINPELAGHPNSELVCLNLYISSNRYILKITPAEFESDSSGILWNDFMDRDIDALEQQAIDEMYD